MKERTSLGHILFRVDGGVLSDTEADLFTDPEDAKHCAKRIIEECRRNDRYANPGHPQYDGSLAEQTRKAYEKRFADAENLANVSLNPDDDLVFLEIFGEIENGPDLSRIGPISATMRALYERHEATWSVMPADERTEFLTRFSENQTLWSNRLQFCHCLERGLSYRHILHEMNRRGIPDRSFIKADYSLLLYLEDYDAWEAWSQGQEHALVERNLRRIGPANVKPVWKCSDPVFPVSAVI